MAFGFGKALGAAAGAARSFGGTNQGAKQQMLQNKLQQMQNRGGFFGGIGKALGNAMQQPGGLQGIAQKAAAQRGLGPSPQMEPPPPMMGSDMQDQMPVQSKFGPALAAAGQMGQLFGRAGGPMIRPNNQANPMMQEDPMMQDQQIRRPMPFGRMNRMY